MEISAKNKTGANVTVNYDLPTDLAGLTAKYGEAVVYSNAKSALVIGLQALLRRNIDKPQEEVQAAVDAYVPGVRASGPRQSTFEKLQNSVDSLSEEEKKELIKRLKAG